MTQSMKPIFWYQGLFLQPQHFQQNDLYSQSLLQPLQTFIQPHFWGSCRLDIRESALKNQVFEVVGGEFVFRDGTWVTYPGNAMLLARSFREHWGSESDKPLKVYVGIKKWDPSGNNAAILKDLEDLPSVSARHISPADPENVKDLHQAGAEAQVKYLYYALKIFWESEVADAGNYELLPVAQLEFNGHDIVLSQRFTPPVLTLACSDLLLNVVKDIREQVTSRCRVLEEYKHPRGFQIQEGDTNALTYLLALRSLNRYVPLLHHMTATPNIHPWNAYALIRELIGELSTFTDRVDSLGRLKDGVCLIPDYGHENLAECFTEAQTLIGELLNQIMIGAENVIYLNREGDYFRAQISVEAFDNRNMFYLVLKMDNQEDNIQDLVYRMIKISCAEQMPTLVRRSLPGMPLDQITILPPGLPRRPDSMYFKLDRSSAEWADIQKNGNICLYWNGAPDETTAELIIIRR